MQFLSSAIERTSSIQWDDDDDVCFVLDMLSLNFIVSAHWNKSTQVDTSLYSHTFYWFWVNQSLLLLLNAACLVEKSFQYIYNTCALSKHIGNMCMRLRNRGKGEALPSLFPRFALNTHIYLYASTVHMYCIYHAILNRK
jgi:hypothetical protein